MENEIMKDLNASIEKNLPAQVGEVLKKRLEQAEQDAARVTELGKILIDRNARISELEKTVSDYRQFDQRNAQLDTREKALDNKERELKIEELKYQLSSEKEKSEFAKSVANGLVRNAEYRSNVFSSKSEPYVDQYNCTQFKNSSSDISETKTQE